jgi:hypothetical protein
MLTNRISRDKIFRFHTKILKTSNKYIKIGIVEINERKNYPSSYETDFAVCMVGRNSHIWVGRQHISEIRGDCYREGDIVITEVDLSKGVVRWIV